VRPQASRALAIVGGALLIVACGGTAPSPVPATEPATAAPSDRNDAVIVTFEVAGDQRYRILLTEPDDIDIAQRLLAGDDAPGIPNGLVVRGLTSVNEGYTWSIDPDDIEFADMTIEVCDGLPSDVEAGVVTSERYCPWSAVVVAVEPAP
jgi:hypothetical protein